MSTATLTADELAFLAAQLNRLRDEIARAPEWCEPTPRGLIAESDDDAIAAAAKVLSRLTRDRRYPRMLGDTSYLPEPTPEPQSLRVPDDSGRYGVGGFTA